MHKNKKLNQSSSAVDIQSCHSGLLQYPCLFCTHTHMHTTHRFHLTKKVCGVVMHYWYPHWKWEGIPRTSNCLVLDSKCHTRTQFITLNMEVSAPLMDKKLLWWFQLYFWCFIWQSFSRRLSFNSSTMCSIALQKLHLLHEGLHVPVSGREWHGPLLQLQDAFLREGGAEQKQRDHVPGHWGLHPAWSRTRDCLV